MPDVSGVPPTDQPAPVTDTPAPQGDTAQNTQTAPTVDWQERYRNAQAEFTRKAQAAAAAQDRIADLERQLAEATQPATQDPTQTTSRGREAEETRRLRAQLEQEQWARAEGIYGAEAIEALRAAEQIAATDPSPIGKLTAYEAYLAKRQVAPKAPPSTAPTRAQAVTPKVDSNQSEVSPDQIREAMDQARKRGGDAGMAEYLRLKRMLPS